MLYLDATHQDYAEWVTEEDVVQLREWGTDMTHTLPRAPRPLPGTSGEQTLHWYIGASPRCYVILHDPSGQTSERHAILSRDSLGWRIGRASQNSLRVDGVLRNSTELAPGMEVQIGGTLLVAESLRMVRLREFVARLLGWSAERQSAVDQALRAIRLSSKSGSRLVLRGEGNLAGAAYDIHTRLYADGHPFVLCETPSSSATANLRRIATLENGVLALMGAKGGTLCIQGHHHHADCLRLVNMLQSSNARVQMVVCSRAPTRRDYTSGFLVEVPSLCSRQSELKKLVGEYCADAAIALGLRDSTAITEIREWVLHNASATIGDIEQATYRLVAQTLGGMLAPSVAGRAS
jgi:FHA domain